MLHLTKTEEKDDWFYSHWEEWEEMEKLENWINKESSCETATYKNLNYHELHYPIFEE